MRERATPQVKKISGQHIKRIVIGLVVIGLGTLAMFADLGPVGFLLNIIGTIIAAIGVIGAGVEAGSQPVEASVREVVIELQRAVPRTPQ